MNKIVCEFINYIQLKFRTQSIDVYLLRFYLFKHCTDYNIPLKIFIDEFNKQYDYEIEDIRTKKYNISAFTKDDIITLRNKMPIGFCCKDVENIGYNYILNNLQMFSTPRKLSIFDYNSECIKHMSLIQLKEALFYEIDNLLLIIEMILKYIPDIEQVYNEIYPLLNVKQQYQFNNKYKSKVTLIDSETNKIVQIVI